MKKLSLSPALALLMGLCFSTIFSSCNKINIDTFPIENEQNWQNQVKSKDGTLIFPSWKDANTAVKFFNETEYKNVASFGKSHDFHSQHQLYHEVLVAEEALLLASLKGFMDVHTVADALAKGYKQPAHSEVYKSAIKSGILKADLDKIDEQFYFYTCIDPTLVPVLDNEGFVAIGDTLWQYTATQKKCITKGGVEAKAILRKASQSDENNGIIVFDKNQNRGVSNSWNFCPSYGCASNNWKTNGNFRARATRTGNATQVSGQNCSFTMNCQFFTSVFAQKKTAFIWWTTGAFTPTFTYNGSWSSEYQATNDPNCCLPSCSVISSAATPNPGLNTSPLVNKPYTSNNASFAFGLHPHTSGYWTASPYDHFTDPWKVTNQMIDTQCPNVGDVD